MNETATFNSTINSKLAWMSRKLRYIDDLNAIVNWVNTMHSIKALLFPVPASSCCSEVANHKTSRTPISVSSSTTYNSQTVNPLVAEKKHVPKLINRLPTLHRSQHGSTSTSKLSPLQHSSFLNISISPIPQTNVQTKYTERSKPTTEFTRPTLCSRLLELSVVPTSPRAKTSKKPILPLHPTPTETAQLKLDQNLKSLNITSISPSLDYKASSETSHPNAFKSPAVGMHFWHGPYPPDPRNDCWAYNQFDSAEEYVVHRATPEEDIPFTVKALKSGKLYNSRLSEKNRLEVDT